MIYSKLFLFPGCLANALLVPQSKFIGPKNEIESQNALTSQQQKMKISDLTAFGTSTSDINNFWNNMIGVYPDGWCINDDDYGNISYIYGQNPCNWWGTYAYKNLGTQKNRYSSSSPAKQVILQQVNPTNCGNAYNTFTVTVNGAESMTASFLTDADQGLTWDGGVDLEFSSSDGNNGNGFDYKTTVQIGQPLQVNDSKDISQQITVQVPPQSYVPVYLVATYYKGNVYYTIPVTGSGQFYSTYDTAVNGYNYWYSGISYALNSDAEIFGFGQVETYFDAKVSVGAAEQAYC